MENRSEEIIGVPRNAEPRLDFVMGGMKVNIRNDWCSAHRPYHDGPWLQGDRAAYDLYGRLQQSVMMDDLFYKTTMPWLFQWAAKEGGGFDTDFLAVTEEALHVTAARMNLGKGFEPDRIAKLSDENKVRYFSRAFGRIEGIRETVWYDPKMAEKKKEVIDGARRYLMHHHNKKIE